MSKMKVLVTGSSGQIGRGFLRHFGHAYDLRLTYNTHPFDAPGHEVAQMDLTDYGSVLKATQGLEAVVHLGADSRGQQPWETVLPNNIVGTYNAMEAAREAGVRRFVYASSNHAAGFALNEGIPLSADAPDRPDSLYGVGKIFGEALGRFYHDKHGLEVICLRIGACHGDDFWASQQAIVQRAIDHRGGYPYDLATYLAIWISPRDMSQLIHCALSADCDWGVFYGISDNDPAAFDLSETQRALGYKPQDNVQDLFDLPIEEL